MARDRNGCKKTGVYCCAAYVIEKLKEEQEVDVFTSVRQIRLSRPQFIVDLVRTLPVLFCCFDVTVNKGATGNGPGVFSSVNT